MPITLPHSIIHIFDDVNLTRYVSAVGFTILVYDSLLTLPNEVRLLWFERWTFVKTLFYLNRFVSVVFVSINTYILSGFAPPLSRYTCQVLLLTTGYAAIFAFAMGNYLLLCRATALWGGTRRIVWGMTIFFLVSYIATISTATVASLQLSPTIFYSNQVHTCAVTIRPTTFGAIWIPSVIFEIVLFLLLFIKLFQHARSVSLANPPTPQPQPLQPQQPPQLQIQGANRRNKLNAISPITTAKITIPAPVMTVTLIRRSPSKILHTLYKDGFVYFVVILGLRLFNLVAWAFLPISLIFIGIFILWSFTTVLLTRMHLNLKAIGHPQRISGTSTSSSTSLSVHQLRRLNLQRAQASDENGGGKVIRGDVEEQIKEEGEEERQVKKKKKEMQAERKKGKEKHKMRKVSPRISFRHSDHRYEENTTTHPHVVQDDDDPHLSHAFTHGGLTTFTIDVNEEELWPDHAHSPRSPRSPYFHTNSYPHHQHVENIDESEDEDDDKSGGGGGGRPAMPL